MKWSWRIATVAGIGIYLHGTFLALLAYVVLAELSGGGSYQNVIFALLFLAALFTIVVLHELGHALAAKRYGIKTQDITLLPIGGVARLERIPEEPKQELVVALAGPAVNVVLAVICVLGIALLIGVSSLHAFVTNGRIWLSMSGGSGLRISSLSGATSIALHTLLQLLYVNIMMVAFNLLPAFPMDGGRVLRALLAMCTSYVNATRIAAKVGQVMAVIFLIVGLFGIPGLLSPNPFLMFIALFVWLGGGAEAAQVESRSMMGGVTARQAMITRFQTVAPHETLHDVTMHIVRGFQQDFPVIEGDKVVGMLTRNDLLKALVEHGREKQVAEVMHKTFETAEAGEPLGKVFERLKNCTCHSLPVMEQGRLVGVIDMENVGEFIALRSAMRTRA
jgi:Zn-dependent protease/predicted transcriptional regulator